MEGHRFIGETSATPCGPAEVGTCREGSTFACEQDDANTGFSSDEGARLLELLVHESVDCVQLLRPSEEDGEKAIELVIYLEPDTGPSACGERLGKGHSVRIVTFV